MTNATVSPGDLTSASAAFTAAVSATAPVALVLRHERMAHLGNLEPVLAEHGYDVRYVEIAEGESVPGALEPHLVIVLGASSGVYETEANPYILDELDFLRERLAAQRPTLGICFGSQIMAAALGGTVHPGDSVQVGFRDITPTVAGSASPVRHFDGVPVLQWHGDTFTLPAEVTLLAGSSDYANEAFGIGNWALAVQWHPEVTADMHEEWLAADEAYATGSGVTPAALRSDRAANSEAMQVASRAFLAEWLDGLDR